LIQLTIELYSLQIAFNSNLGDKAAEIHHFQKLLFHLINQLDTYSSQFRIKTILKIKVVEELSRNNYCCN